MLLSQDWANGFRVLLEHGGLSSSTSYCLTSQGLRDHGALISVMDHSVHEIEVKDNFAVLLYQ